MAVDSTSPIAPARVKVLLLPAGHISRSRFLSFVERLTVENVVRLGDVTPDANAASFSPLAFPRGVILYNFTTQIPTSAHIALSPFETFREPLIVICVADATSDVSSTNDGHCEEGQNGSIMVSTVGEDLRDAMQMIRAHLPRSPVLLPLLLDSLRRDKSVNLPQETIIIPQVERPTTIKTVMADISSIFLRELSLLARSIQTAPPLDLLYNASHGLSTSQFPVSVAAGVPLRTTSLGRQTLSSSGSATIDSSPNGQLTAFSSMHSSPVLGIGQRDTNSHSQSRPISSAYKTNDQKKQSRHKNKSSSDLASSKLQARQAVIIGSYYLHAGRWPDALSQLVDGATRSKAYNDYLWYGKALENLMVTILLLVWAGYEFQIPHICMASPPRTSSSKRKSTSGTYSAADVKPAAESANSDMLQIISSLIPDLSVLIANTYAYSANAQGELTFPFAFSESIVRLARLQSVQHILDGVLTPKSMQYIVLGQRMPDIPLRPKTERDGLFSRYIYDFLLKGYPPKTTVLGFTVTDSVVILTGMASVLASVGMVRKQALIERQLLLALSSAISTHVQNPTGSRLTAQALQPSTGGDSFAMQLAGFSDAQDLTQMLDSFCSKFGATETTPSQPVIADEASTVGELMKQVAQEYSSSLYGSQYMKVDILRISLAAAEAILDHSNMLRFIVRIFAILRPQYNPITGIMNIRYRLPREEILELASKLYTVDALRREQGMGISMAPYWDPFLLRGVDLQETNPAMTFHTLAKASFSPLAMHGRRPGSISGPFLHSALSKATDVIVKQSVIAARDTVDFVLSLENLYEFDLEIEGLTLLTKGVEFQHHPLSAIVGPTRLQRVTVSGVPLAAGQLEVYGCKAIIKGCKEQSFLVFPKMWQPHEDKKVSSHRNTRLTSNAIEPTLSVTLSTDTIKPSKILTSPSSSVSFTVIESQPLLVITSTTLPQSAIPLLEGEIYRFSIILHNTSTTITADFIHVSFEHSFNPETISSTDNDTEIETPFSRKPPSESSSLVVEAQSSVTIELDVVGIRGLLSGNIIIDYASLGRPFADITPKFHTRQLALSNTFTVSPAIYVESIKLYPSKHAQLRTQIETSSNDNNNLVAIDDFVMLQLCLCNNWKESLEVSLENNLMSAEIKKLQASVLLLHPAQSGRLQIRFKRVIIKATKESSNSWQNGRRELAISLAGSDRDQESWIRQALAKQLSCKWRDSKTGSEGTVDLTHVELDSAVCRGLRADSIKVRIGVEGGPDNETLQDQPNKLYHTKSHDALTLVIRLCNQSGGVPSLRLQLTARFTNDAGQNDDNDMDQHIAWTGASSQPLSPLRDGEECDVFIGLCFLSEGVFEISATVSAASGSSSGSEDQGIVEEKVMGSGLCTITVHPD